MGKLILERPTYREVKAQFQFTRAVDSITVQLKCQQKSRRFELQNLFVVDPESLDKQGWGQFKVPFHLAPGKTFKLQVCGMVLQPLNEGIKCVEKMEQEFRSEFTIAELEELHRRTLDEIRKIVRRPANCLYMTRNKLFTYYQDIMSKKKGIMEKYIKDNNGDPASVINGTIHGLFFATAVDRESGLPPRMSNFGPQRLNVPTRLLISPTVNLYFADFYCNKVAHYVTLVLCRDGSVEDVFCRPRLLSLDILNNPFLWIAADGSVWVTDCIWVEVFVTEDIDINLCLRQGARWDVVESPGTSRPGGIPKRKGCKICNLYP